MSSGRYYRLERHAVDGNSDKLSVWDWSRRRQLSRFPNGNLKKANITSLQIINQDVGGMLLASSGSVLLP